jgi:hypothetical protein
MPCLFCQVFICAIRHQAIYYEKCVVQFELQRQVQISQPSGLVVTESLVFGV